MKGAFYTQDFSLVPENTELYTAYTHTHTWMDHFSLPNTAGDS